MNQFRFLAVTIELLPSYETLNIVLNQRETERTGQKMRWLLGSIPTLIRSNGFRCTCNIDCCLSDEQDVDDDSDEQYANVGVRGEKRA